ncbi:MAG TPA: hypothetical protein VHW96_23610 [Solirubrobacteraceae bacterium]|jgi:hypothetical protein|nr:hypothetical protein [Solirubrobacteraceae bacterium]
MAPDPGIAAEPSGHPIEARTPSAGAGTGEPSAGSVSGDGHPCGHGMEMAGIGTVGTAPTTGAGMIGRGGIGTTVTGATRTGAPGAGTAGLAGGAKDAPARAADAATGRGGSAARAG